MTIAYFDCFSGVSGDMIVGALLAAGASEARLREELAPLGLAGVELAVRPLTRQGLVATKFDVRVRGQAEGAAPLADVGDGHAHGHHHDHAHHHGLPTPPDPSPAHAHGQRHTRDHSHNSAHPHDHPHAQAASPGSPLPVGEGGRRPGEASHAHRTLADVEAVLARLPAGPREQAIAIYRRLADAEARVHGSTRDAVHFHEVGADDAIVDVAATVLCLRQLGVTEVQCSALPLGSGMVRCAHGLMPVPVPAVALLVAGVPTHDNGERGELVTPTGAAILATLATRFGPLPTWRPTGAVGFGAGSREGERVPNLLRVLLGEALTAPGQDEVAELEASLDDMSPQLLAPLGEALLAAGALDWTLTPTLMKKGRPGFVLQVLCPPERLDALAALVFRETTTLGLRHRLVHRRVLARELVPVATPWGPVRVKLGRLDGALVNVAPELEDCRRVAAEAGLPLKEVWQEALASARRGGL
ncbi:MAG: nickel pincer cofactor biosynthesis protein LarC [Candidatus Sericytochromatia bacterium]|nr:nickel pincer cofactor biosynthesis protein LarC [Candidatus Sericytochromatia bacterium]